MNKPIQVEFSPAIDFALIPVKGFEQLRKSGIPGAWREHVRSGGLDFVGSFLSSPDPELDSGKKEQNIL